MLRGEFRLRSGAHSTYYIDKYQFTTRPRLLRGIAEALVARVPSGVVRVAGPVLGAVPLVTAISLATDLPMVIVRVDKAKEYGTARQIEGTLNAGERVLLVEDVVTTGGAALAAVEALRQAGAEIAQVFAVVDREEGGAAAFASAGVPYAALFTRTALGLG